MESLRLAEPYLREGKKPSLGILIDRKQGPTADSEQERRRELVLSVSRKLANAVSSPAQPFELKDLLEMRDALAAASAEEQNSLKAEVKRQSKGRCERLPEKLLQEVKAIAENLMTDLAKGGVRGKYRLSNVLPGLERQRAFLTWMMVSDWFLNAGRPAVWGKAEEPGEPSIELYLDGMWEALGNARQESPATSEVP